MTIHRKKEEGNTSHLFFEKLHRVVVALGRWRQTGQHCSDVACQGCRQVVKLVKSGKIFIFVHHLLEQLPEGLPLMPFPLNLTSSILGNFTFSFCDVVVSITSQLARSVP